MIRGRQKGKGNSYEIIVSRILSKWYLDDGDDHFWRTAGSGAKSTVTRRGETSFVGDIVFLPQPDALQVWIDAKDRKEATFDNIISDNKFCLKEWYDIEIKKRDALGVDKPVMIIFTFYRKKENYVFFHEDDFDFNLLDCYGAYLQWTSFIVMRLDCFLENVKREEFVDE
jgi:hypothetical protein